MEDKVRAAVRVVLSTGNLEDLTSRKVVSSEGDVGEVGLGEGSGGAEPWISSR